MKNIITLFAAASLFAACSSPKYAYHFDHYDYNSGKKKVSASPSNVETAQISNEAVSPLLLEPQALVADASGTPAELKKKEIVLSDEQKQTIEKIASMSKSELKSLKKDLKKEVKAIKKEKKNGDQLKETKAWDHDLKMAAIFGIVGLVFTALYGVSPVFWIIGVIALVVGLIFLIQWISRQ